MRYKLHQQAYCSMFIMTSFCIRNLTHSKITEVQGLATKNSVTIANSIYEKRLHSKTSSY